MRTVIITVMLLIVPVVIFFLFTSKKAYGLNRKICYMFAFLAMNFVMDGLIKILKPGWSWYEYAMIEFIFSISLISFIQVIENKIKFSIQMVLERVCC